VDVIRVGVIGAGWIAREHRRVLESVAAEARLDAFIERALALDEIVAVQPRILRGPDGAMSIEID